MTHYTVAAPDPLANIYHQITYPQGVGPWTNPQGLGPWTGTFCSERRDQEIQALTRQWELQARKNHRHPREKRRAAREWSQRGQEVKGKRNEHHSLWLLLSVALEKSRPGELLVWTLWLYGHHFTLIVLHQFHPSPCNLAPNFCTHCCVLLVSA